MKFGQKQHHSRYYGVPPSKKKALYSPQQDNILPLIYPGKSLDSSPVTKKKAEQERQTVEYSDYMGNAAMLEAFRQQAQHRRLMKRISEKRAPALGAKRLVTELPYNSATAQIMTLINRDRREMGNLMEEIIKERDQLYGQLLQEKEVVEDYKERYERIKSKFQAMERSQQKKVELELSLNRKNVGRMKRIKHSMSGITDEIKNNSALLSHSYASPTINRQLRGQRLERLYSVPSSNQNSTIFNRYSLDEQYEHLQSLRKQIKQLDVRLKKGYQN